MKDEIDYESMSVFEQIEAGLIQALADGCGELTLKTTILPLPPPPEEPAKVISPRLV